MLTGQSRAIMVSKAVQKLQLLVTQRNGTPTGTEDAVIEEMRKKLKLPVGTQTNERLVAQFLFGVHPLLIYVKSALPAADVGAMSAEQLGECIYELFKIAAGHTSLVKLYGALLDSAELWAEVEIRLAMAQRTGLAPARPDDAPAAASASAAKPPPETVHPWWASNLFGTLLVLFFSVMYGYLKQYSESGRVKVVGLAQAAAIGLVALLWRRYGPRHLPFTGTTVIVPDESDAEADDAEGAASDASSAATSRRASRHEAIDAEALQTVLQANDRLLQRVRGLETAANSVRPATLPAPSALSATTAARPEPPSASFQMLADYAAGAAPAEGPVSATALRMQEEARRAAGAPPIPGLNPDAPGFRPQMPAALAGAPAPVQPPPTWAPLGTQGKTQHQARQLLEALNAAESRKSFDPFWSNQLWQSVSALHTREYLEPDLLRMLTAHGYFGPSSTTAPLGDLRGDLNAFHTTGAPIAGAALVPAVGASGAVTTHLIGNRWQTMLPPDMKRAAPEIYRNLRSQGVATLREWTDRNFKGNRASDLWTELWHLATEVDFRLGGVQTDQELFAVLASDDSLEMQMRRLSSYIYESRTGDKAGAQQMLAVAAPGQDVDLAPTWLVRDATEHSRVEHQRAERVHGHAYGRGRGRGRAPGRGPPGDDYGGAAPPADKGDAKARGRGRRGGRGRGGAPAHA